MLIRALCVVFLFFASPVSTWAASFCCEAGDACCEDEHPACPVLPDGSCSIAAAGLAVATLSRGPEQPAPLPAQDVEFEAIALIRRSLVASAPASQPPRFLLLQPLRN